MQKRLWKAAAVVFTACALAVSSYGSMAVQAAAAGAVSGDWEQCPLGVDTCDGGDTCTHRGVPGDSAGNSAGNDYGRLTQAELEQMAREDWHDNLKGSLRLGAILLKLENGETVLLAAEATEAGMVINSYYKGERIAGTDVLTEDIMVLEGYTILLNNGDEKAVEMATEPAGASAHINNLVSITLSGANYEELTLDGDLLADLLTAIGAALA